MPRPDLLQLRSLEAVTCGICHLPLVGLWCQAIHFCQECSVLCMPRIPPVDASSAGSVSALAVPLDTWCVVCHSPRRARFCQKNETCLECYRRFVMPRWSDLRVSAARECQLCEEVADFTFALDFLSLCRPCHRNMSWGPSEPDRTLQASALSPARGVSSEAVRPPCCEVCDAFTAELVLDGLNMWICAECQGVYDPLDPCEGDELGESCEHCGRPREQVLLTACLGEWLCPDCAAYS